MQFNRFTAAVLTAGALVLLSINTASAADGQFLADRHVARGVACASCHGKETPKAGAKVYAVCGCASNDADPAALGIEKLFVSSDGTHSMDELQLSCRRTTTIWSALIVPNATAVTSKA